MGRIGLLFLGSGTEALMEVLLANMVVSTMGLRANSIGPRGGQAIANVLRHSRPSLYHNNGTYPLLLTPPFLMPFFCLLEFS